MKQWSDFLVSANAWLVDPNTVRWLNDNLDPVFGYPSIIRFSWSTTATLLEKKGTSVIWLVDVCRHSIVDLGG